MVSQGTRSKIARPIAELCKRPTPSCAILLGKGPSLDSYDAKDNPSGAYVMGINEVPLVIRCDGVVWTDPIFEKTDFSALNPHIDIFRPAVMAWSHDGRGYGFMSTFRPFGWGPQWQMHGIIPGTPCRALDILILWGIRRVFLYGFDGMRQSTEGFDNNGRHFAAILDGITQQGCSRDYRIISRGILRTIEFAGIQATYAHE